MGHVKIDGKTIQIDENGVLSANIQINPDDFPEISFNWDDIKNKPIISNISKITTYNKDSHLLTINVISSLIDNAVKNVPGLTDAEREKLNNIEERAQVNKIEAIVFNNQPLEIVDKTVRLPDLSSTPETTVVNNFEIGTIFAHVSNNTPYGALALTGQIIDNCKGIYPDFWNYVIKNAVGEDGEKFLESVSSIPEYIDWQQPVLSSFQTIYGENEYAAWMSQPTNGTLSAYLAFNNDYVIYHSYASSIKLKAGDTNERSIYFYSPEPLKIYNINLNNASAAAATMLSSYVIERKCRRYKLDKIMYW